MLMEAFFEKLLAYEHELIQQSHAEHMKKKIKGISLKANSSKEAYKECSNSDEEAKNFSLIVKMLGKFLKKSKDKKFSKPSKKIDSINSTFTFFECGKQGRIKSKCPIYLRKQVGEMKGKNKKQKKNVKVEKKTHASHR